MYKQIVQVINNIDCKNIGIKGTRSDYEYPLWVLTKKKHKNLNIFHVDVANISNKLKDKKKIEPCALLDFNSFGFNKKYINKYENLISKIILNFYY